MQRDRVQSPVLILRHKLQQLLQRYQAADARCEGQGVISLRNGTLPSLLQSQAKVVSYDLMLSYSTTQPSAASALAASSTLSRLTKIQSVSL